MSHRDRYSKQTILKMVDRLRRDVKAGRWARACWKSWLVWTRLHVRDLPEPKR